VFHAEQFLIVVGRSMNGTAYALPIKPQTMPLHRAQVPLSPDESARLGLRRLASIISTDSDAVIWIEPSRSPRVLGFGGVALLDRIESTARRSRETAALERLFPPCLSTL
jgi:hypothetical protein